MPRLSGLGKATAIKHLQNDHRLEQLGELNTALPDKIAEASSFVAACYGKSSTNMSNVRFDVWLTKMTIKNNKQTPKLQSLPPTSESFSENVKRAHLQTCIWKSAMDSEPPDLDPTTFGWIKDTDSKILTPLTIPADRLPAPPIVLQIICCRCASDQPCATARCSYYESQIPSTILCNCFLTSNCQNSLTRAAAELSDDEILSDSDSENVEYTANK